MMIKTGGDMFVRLPSGSADRVLHHGTVLALDGDDGCTLEVRGRDLTLEVGMELLIYYEVKRQFVQQPARVVSLPAPEEIERSAPDVPTTANPVFEEAATTTCIAALEATGDPVSAENRHHYRVSTIAADVEATVCGEACPVQDISATGFAIVARAAYEVGTTLPAGVAWEGLSFSGQACVQSVREASGGRTRYGLRYTGSGDEADAFREGLNRISLGVQREQLRRMSGMGRS